MSRWSKCLVVSALAGWVVVAGAQPAYPTKPVRLIVPTPAGGPSDAVARVMAKGMTTALGQEVFVENRPGGNTGIAAGAVLNAPADGYTLLFALASNAGLPHLSKASPYKSLAEFTPIAGTGGNTQCLVVPASVPAKTLKEFAAYAKASAKPLMRGANNVSEDMVAAEITRALGFSLDRVSYKGVPQMLPDLLEGRIQSAVMPIGASVPHQQAGRVTILGCSMAERIPSLASIPTLAEAGVAAEPVITAHYVLGPPRVPAEIVDRLAAAARDAAQTAEFKQTMDRLLISGGVRSPAEAQKQIQQAEAQYLKFVRETGASID